MGLGAVAPEGAEVWSAGSQPAVIDPAAIEVMREIGFDISAQRAKGLDDVPWKSADTVVTLCGDAEEVCPQLGAAVRRVHWPLPDPAVIPDAGRLAAFRETRDEIRWRISSLWPGGD